MDRVVLFNEAAAAEVFLAEVYPLFAHCLVASSDGVYPRDTRLREKLFAALKNDAKIKVAVFGLASLKALPLQTDRLLVMDEIVMHDFRKHPEDRKAGLGLDAAKIAFLLRTFFQQWERMARIGNPTFGYEKFAEFDEKRFDWRAKLMGIRGDVPGKVKDAPPQR